MAKLLRSMGCAVHLAASVGEALRGAQGDLPDVLLSDIGLPDGSGLDLVRQLRQMPAGGGVTAVALSGFGTDDDLTRSRDAGFDRHLTKPVDLARLTALVDELKADRFGPS